MSYPILLDLDMRYATALAILGLPTTVFVGRNGTIDSVATGELDEAQMKQRADVLLRASE